MWIPFIWVLAAAMTAYVANERGRSGVVWFFLALFVPVVSILCLIALPALPKSPPPTPQQVMNYRLRLQRFN